MPKASSFFRKLCVLLFVGTLACCAKFTTKHIGDDAATDCKTNTTSKDCKKDEKEKDPEEETTTETAEPPANAGVSMSFTDTDAIGGQISGDVLISPASDESDISNYVLYWGSSSTEKLQTTPIGKSQKTGATLTYSIAAATAIPSGATHLLVFTENDVGEMAEGISVLIIDLGVPTDAAVSVTFTDTDTDGGDLDGTVTITKAIDESDVTDYVLYWGTSSSAKQSGTPITTIPKTGANLTYTLTTSSIPGGSTHLLVFTKNAGGEMATGVSVAIIDLGVPIHAAASVAFTDSDLDGGQLSGTVNITKAANESDVTDYVLYWGSSTTVKQSATPIDTVPKTGGNVTSTIAVNTAKPGAATHLLVFTKNADGEMATGVNVAISDLGVPIHAAAGVSFTDTDGDANQLTGNVTITKAANETDVTHYVLYWGASSTTKDSATAIATLAVTGANRTHTFAANTAKPVTSTHLLVFTKNADGEMATGVNVLIADRTVPIHKAGGIIFNDTDADNNELGGTITITKATDESDITHYVLYWGATSNFQPGSSPGAIATIGKTGADINYTVNANTVIPADAFFFIVFTKNADGEFTGTPAVSTRIADVGGTPPGSCAINDGTFTSYYATCQDIATGLYWSKVLGNTVEGEVPCAITAGFVDWRHPSTGELQAVATHGGATHITGSSGQSFWGNTSNQAGHYDGDIVNMDNGIFSTCDDSGFGAFNCWYAQGASAICVRP